MWLDGARPRYIWMAAAVAVACLITVRPGSTAGMPALDRGSTPELTVTGVPASIGYVGGGTTIPAGGRSRPTRFEITITASTPVQVHFAGSDFTGPVSLPADTRLVRLGPAHAGLIRQPQADDGWNPTTATSAWNPIYASSTAIRDASFVMGLRISVPTDAVAGTYRGSIELSFVQAPDGGPYLVEEAVQSSGGPDAAVAVTEGGAADDPAKGKDIPRG